MVIILLVYFKVEDGYFP